MKTIKEMIEVMQAYDEGKEIEIFLDDEWVELEETPTWSWGIYDYKIKKEEKNKFKVGDYIVRIPTEKNCNYHCLLKIKGIDKFYYYIYNIFSTTNEVVKKELIDKCFENALDDRFLWYWEILIQNGNSMEISKFNERYCFSDIKKISKENFTNSHILIKPLYELGFIDKEYKGYIKDFINASE